MTTISTRQVDLYQGVCEDGAGYGYVSGEGGGFFFTWRPTLAATIASVEADAVDGDGGMDASEVIEMLTVYLPTTPRGREMWTTNGE